MLLEPIQGESGVIAPSSDYLGGVRELCTERGILLMVDEIQTGLGRTGRWFAFQHTGIEPDVVTMAKALGNGVPIGACWARAEVAAAFSPGDHGSTFGGQPLAAAAARATLAVMEAEDVPGPGGPCRGPTAGRARGARRGGRRPGGRAPARGGARPRTGQGRRGGGVGARPRGERARVRTPSGWRPSLLVSDDEIDEGLEILSAALADVAPRRRRGATAS